MSSKKSRSRGSKGAQPPRTPWSIKSKIYQAPWNFIPVTTTKFAFVERDLDWMPYPAKLFTVKASEPKTEETKETKETKVLEESKVIEESKQTTDASTEPSNDVVVSRYIYLKEVSALEKRATPSLVGKGATTVLDTAARQSAEIPAESITLSSDFHGFLEKTATSLYPFIASSVAGESAKPIKLKLHKLIVYSEGSFFKPHMDALHSGQDWPMTLSVELAISRSYSDTGTEGGRLCIQQPGYSRKIGESKDVQPYLCGDMEVPDDYVIVPEAKGVSVRLALFWHDVQHCVTTLTKGKRLVLTFDAQVDKGDSEVVEGQGKEAKSSKNPRKRKTSANASKMAQPPADWVRYKDMATEVSKLGFARLGLMCGHVYHGTPTFSTLKGHDQLLWQVMSSLCDPRSLRIIPLMEMDSYVYHRDMLPLIKESSSFHELYRCKEEDEEDEEDEEEEEEEQENSGDEDGDGDTTMKDKEDGSKDSKSESSTEVKQEADKDVDTKEELKDELKEEQAASSPTHKKLKTDTLELPESAEERKKKANAALITQQVGLFEELKEQQNILAGQNPRVQYDRNGRYKMVANDPTYRIGDVFFVRSKDMCRTLTYRGNSEAMLGNEGFDGEIHELVAIAGKLTG